MPRPIQQQSLDVTRPRSRGGANTLRNSAGGHDTVSTRTRGKENAMARGHLDICGEKPW